MLKLLYSLQKFEDLAPRFHISETDLLGGFQFASKYFK